MKGRVAGILLGTLALGLGAASVVLDPNQTLTPTATWALGRAAGVALLWGLAAVGAGGALLRRVAPALVEGELALLHSFVVGLAAWGLGAGLLAAMGLLAPIPLLGLGLTMMLGHLTGPRMPLPRIGLPTAAALAAVLLVGLIDAAAPPFDTDELYQHLALPRLMLREGGLIGGVLHPDGSRPMALHLPYAALLLFGGESAPRLFHLGTAALLLVGVDRIVSRTASPGAGGIATWALIGSWTFLQVAGLAGTDLPTALATLVAFDAALAGSAWGLGLAAGAALAIKYTAAWPLVGCFLVARLPWRARILAGVGALGIVVPWWARNLSQGLHPLFPFAGWPGSFHFQYLEKYGAGRDLLATLALPWNLFMGADPTSFTFLGRLNPVLLALLPLALWQVRRGGLIARAMVVVATGFVGWAAGPQWLRYLLPTLPFLAIAGASAFSQLGSPRLAGMGLLLCFGMGLPANWGTLLPRLADRWLAATGRETREAYLGRKVDGYAAYAWANARLPEDARVALFFSWTGYLLDRDQVLGSVEDHIPTRHWLLSHGERSVQDLRAIGVTHLIAQRIHFLHKVYPFLSEEVFQAEFQDPEELLERLLLHEATLIFQDGRTRVYRLEDPAPESTAAP